MSVTTFDQEFPLPTTPARVFRALTDEAELRIWFAENVEVEPCVGGKFKFWGRRVPWVTRPSDADGVLTRFAVPREFSFRWTFRGCASETDFIIAAKDGRAELRIKQTTTGKLWRDENESKWVLADFWRAMIGNLRSYLLTGAPAMTHDYSPRGGQVVLTIDIDAPPHRVFHALINPETMDRWLTKGARVEPRAGGAYVYGWTQMINGIEIPAGPSKVVEIVPDQRLTHDWKYSGEEHTQVTWELAPLPGNKTRVTLTHTKFDDLEVHGGYAIGWASFLVGLKETAES